jgi:hypothetical protein
MLLVDALYQGLHKHLTTLVLEYQSQYAFSGYSRRHLIVPSHKQILRHGLFNTSAMSLLRHVLDLLPSNSILLLPSLLSLVANRPVFLIRLFRMPTTVYDASLVTRRARNNALYTFYVNNNAAVNAGLSVRREQPDTQLQTIVAERKETSANTNPGPVGTCPCTVAVNDNRGGNMGNNVQ